jgi:hypothetical protein
MIPETADKSAPTVAKSACADYGSQPTKVGLVSCSRDFNRRKSNRRLPWRLLGLWGALLLLLGCADAVTPLVVSPLLPPTQMATAVPLLVELPPTSTPAPTSTVVAAATAVAAPIIAPQATTSPQPSPTFAAYGISQTIGFSGEGRPIVSYQFGYGADDLVLVGGIHGGYEWNTIVLAYELIDYLTAHPELIPANVTLHIIPSANPDGQFVATGSSGRVDGTAVYNNTIPGRFNANGVDLNRNWDCEWSAEAVWSNTAVSGGDAPFSEPETQALRRFFWRIRPQVVLFWHSKADGVFAAGCGATYPPSVAAAEQFATAAEYPLFNDFSHYPVTGDASNWLATQGIASFTVELKTHNGADFAQNLAGVLALLDLYGRTP